MLVLDQPCTRVLHKKARISARWLFESSSKPREGETNIIMSCTFQELQRAAVVDIVYVSKRSYHRGHADEIRRRPHGGAYNILALHVRLQHKHQCSDLSRHDKMARGEKAGVLRPYRYHHRYRYRSRCRSDPLETESDARTVRRSSSIRQKNNSTTSQSSRKYRVLIWTTRTTVCTKTNCQHKEPSFYNLLSI